MDSSFFGNLGRASPRVTLATEFAFCSIATACGAVFASVENDLKVQVVPVTFGK
jgi:hypothetical protein